MREAQVMFNGLTEEETMKTASCAGLMTQPAGVYPAAPEGVATLCEYGGDVFTAAQMRAFADATHALRVAPHGQAPAQAAAPIKTLEEAIAHAKEKAKDGSACAYEHAKLTAWLTELQLLRAARTAPAHAGEYPALVCDYCGALTPDPWHSSGMLHGKMSKHIHSCDACRGAAQPAPKQEVQEIVEIPKQCPYFGPSPHRDTWLDGWYAASASTAPQVDALDAAQRTNHAD